MTSVWYAKGLRFKCTECGQCCTGGPGYVWITDQEIEEMSQFLALTREAFLKQYTRQVGERIALLERLSLEGNYDCIFLKNRKCTLYKVRPKQCRTYPWWKENLNSQKDWQEAAQICEGINHPEAPLIPIEEIVKVLKSKS